MDSYLVEVKDTLDGVYGRGFFALCLKTPIVKKLIEEVLEVKRPKVIVVDEFGGGIMGVNSLRTELYLNKASAKISPRQYNVASFAHELCHISQRPHVVPTGLDKRIKEEAAAYTVTF